MPLVDITGPDGRSATVEFDKDPTPEDVDAAAAQVFGPPEGDGGFLDQLLTAETGVRAVGGTVAGIIGSVPSPPTTAAALAVGGASEAVAQGIEQAKGKREGFNLGTIALEAGLSAIPGGKLAAGGKVLTAAGKEALKIGAAEAVGAQARSLLEEGELASPMETLVAGGAGALGGAVGGAVAQRVLTKDAAETAQAAAKAAPTGEQFELPLRRSAEQFEIFDDAGRVRPTVQEFSDIIVEGTTARGSAQIVDAVRKEGAEAARLLARTDASQQGQRLFRQVGELLETGQLQPDESLLSELAERGLTMQTYVKDFYIPSITRGARNMAQLSRLSKELAEKGLIDDETAQLLSRGGKKNRVLDFIQRLDDTRRGLLISQVRTGVRNAVTQGVAAAGDLLEAGLTGGFTGMRDHFQGFAQALGRKESADRVAKLLQGRIDLKRKFGDLEFRPPTMIDDVAVLKGTIGKLTEATTFVNRWQEMFFRNAKFDATLRQGLREAGVDMSQALSNPKLIPEGLLDKSVDAAMELTFSAANPGKLGDLVSGIQLSRPLFTLVAPFPRYMANAATYIAKHNPLGLVRLATKAGRKNAKKVLAEASIGTAFMGGALGLRLSPAAGEKWYEVKHGDKRYDVRGVAGPFAAYLFMAEAFKQYAQKGVVEFSAGDVFEGLLSMNRLGGTMQAIASELNKEGSEGVQGFLTQMAADWVGGFATPLRTFTDLMSIGGVDEEAVFRDVRGQGIGARLLQNVPGARQSLPAAVSPITGKERRTESPLLFGTIGLNARTVETVEAEAGRLGLQNKDLFTATGIPKADRALARRVGKFVSMSGPNMVTDPRYQALNDAQKIVWMRELFKDAAKHAREDLAETDPALAEALKGKKELTKAVRRVLESQGHDPGAVLEQLVAASPEE